MNCPERKYKLDGTGYSATMAVTTTSNPFYLFSVNGNTAQVCYCKVYSAKFYNNDILVRDYIPVLDRYTNKAGLYDRVTNTFYGNNGTGDFIYG